jgi:hypothetical protein
MIKGPRTVFNVPRNPATAHRFISKRASDMQVRTDRVDDRFSVCNRELYSRNDVFKVRVIEYRKQQNIRVLNEALSGKTPHVDRRDRWVEHTHTHGLFMKYSARKILVSTLDYVESNVVDASWQRLSFAMTN